MPPLCLLFDSDGTLVDSEILLAEVMAEVLSHYDLPFTALRYIREFRGVRFLTIVNTLEQTYGALAPDALEEMENTLRAKMEDRMREQLLPMPGMRDALAALRGHDCAVVSNGPERKVRCAMQSSGLAEFFGDNLFSAYTLKLWKPDPRLYQAAARLMGYPLEQCVVIDDAAVGVQAGLLAGMHVIHFNHFPEHEQTPSGAIAMHHASELPALIAQLSRSLDMPMPHHRDDDEAFS
jgi:HAD superfamily hydrolase (TIGR01509 family)